MMEKVHVFTSVTANYIPKARVLANSVKHFHPDFQFHLVLSDRLPADFDLAQEPFDSILPITELPIPDLNGWIFKHSLVEMCTGVKGIAFDVIFERFNADKVFYFDPDIVIFSKLDLLLDKLDTSSVLLTPHQTQPDELPEAIVDNEICSLKHGIYNLGFLGVKSSDAGRQFIKWWAKRLLLFCYDDKLSGLFTDQRWVDLAPAFFEDIHIVREPNCNVSTWNLSNRVATGTVEGGVLINNMPLCFYHFSGFDSGNQEIMLKKYGSNSPVLFELRKQYISNCEKQGQNTLGSIACIYSTFEDGTPITRKQRTVYKKRVDLQQAFPNPFSLGDGKHSYKQWCKGSDYAAISAMPDTNSVEALKLEILRAHGELDYIKQSRTWKAVQKMRKLLGRNPLKYTG